MDGSGFKSVFADYVIKSFYIYFINNYGVFNRKYRI
jgi:hypothetical protein